MKPVLHIENLKAGVGNAIIEGFSATANKGELIILSGINGSGKSTLLKTIAGIIPMLSGNIQICGNPLKGAGHIELSRLLAYSGTNRISDDYITLEELVSFGRFPYGHYRKQPSEQAFIDHCMTIMDIYGIKHKYLNNVSDGEWQKGNIARVLAQQTPLIIMDEPSVFLDYPSRNRLFTDLKRICDQEGKTVLISTHDMEIASRFGSQFWHIEGNQVKQGQNPPVWQL